MSKDSQNKEDESKLQEKSPRMTVPKRDQFNESQFYEALSHEIRRDIILLIGDQGFAGFSNMKKLTQASTGAIYHHLDVLKDLINQNNKKKYYLTEQGIHAYKFLINNRQQEPRERENEKNNPNKFLDVFLLKPIIKYLANRAPWTTLISHLIIILIGIICAIFNIQSYLFFYSANPPIWDFWINSKILSRFVTFFSVIIGYYVIYFTIEGILSWIFDKKFFSADLWHLFGISFLPLLIHVIIIALVKTFSLNNNNLSILLGPSLILFQLWSMLIMGYLISQLKQISIEKAMLITIFLDYGTLFLLLMFNLTIF
jgi:hypothetical protein